MRLTEKQLEWLREKMPVFKQMEQERLHAEHGKKESLEKAKAA